MATSLLQILDQLQAQVSLLQQKINELEQRNAALTVENEDLRRDADGAIKQRDEALLDVEFLKMSHKLANNDNTIIETRRHIAQLIRNIDRCILMLKE